jgi:hypothetical protein
MVYQWTRKNRVDKQCISEVPAPNSYRRLPDFSERFIRREMTPKPSSIEAQGEVGFLHSRYVYYTIITILKQHTLHDTMRCRTSCLTDVCHKTDFEQPVVQRCRSISTLYVFSITLGVLLYPTAL